MPIELRDSWFSAKDILVSRLSSPYLALPLWVGQ